MLFGIYLIQDQLVLQQWLSYQNLEKNTIELGLTFDIAPKTFCQYVDGSHARFGSRGNATEFLNVLNNQNLLRQYTIEFENDHKELNFFDVKWIKIKQISMLTVAIIISFVIYIRANGNVIKEMKKNIL